MCNVRRSGCFKILTHLRLRRLQQLEQKADPQKSRRGEKEGNGGGGGGTATERLADTVGWPGAPSPPVPLVDHGPLSPKQPLSSTYTSHFTLAYRISILVVHSRGPVFLTSSCPPSDVAHGPGYGLVVSTTGALLRGYLVGPLVDLVSASPLGSKALHALHPAAPVDGGAAPAPGGAFSGTS